MSGFNVLSWQINELKGRTQKSFGWRCLGLNFRSPFSGYKVQSEFLRGT